MDLSLLYQVDVCQHVPTGVLLPGVALFTPVCDEGERVQYRRGQEVHHQVAAVGMQTTSVLSMGIASSRSILVVLI